MWEDEISRSSVGYPKGIKGKQMIIHIDMYQYQNIIIKNNVWNVWIDMILINKYIVKK
jgi:hypothetical protein